ncbi:MAG: 30S ribosomal protein S12 methylthiotransferase RimO [Akkermansiaceae bacterium]|nr:30S ribosomal protein S12 methylthiotransferase RimO [Akkermansiaceae bacterium]
MQATFGLISLGCAKNQVDSEIMTGVMEEAGFVYAEPERAQVLIINTCGFIDPAKQEAIDTIFSAVRARENGEAPAEQKILVAGCLSQRYASDLSVSMPEADCFIGVDKIGEVAEIAAACLNGTAERIYTTKVSRLMPDYGMPRTLISPPHYAYIKIAEGCNHACAYCAIPRIRGAHRSRPMANVVKEARHWVEQGVKEINLIAQDTTYYGMDKWKGGADKTSGVDSTRGESLAGLLRELNAIPGDFWIRVLYTHPAHWSRELIDTFVQCEKVVKYVDIPLQHIANHILEEQRRKTDGDYIRRLIRDLRAAVPGIGLRTTFISGLPGETEEDHAELRDFVREFRFERAGVFAYSKEEGTLAAKMKPQVHHATKKRRANELSMIMAGIADEIGQECIGRTIRVLVDAPGVARGPWDAPDVDGSIHVDPALPVGEFADVEITDAIAYELFANGAEEE